MELMTFFYMKLYQAEASLSSLEPTFLEESSKYIKLERAVSQDTSCSTLNEASRHQSLFFLLQMCFVLFSYGSSYFITEINKLEELAWRVWTHETEVSGDVYYSLVLASLFVYLGKSV